MDNPSLNQEGAMNFDKIIMYKNEFTYRALRINNAPKISTQDKNYWNEEKIMYFTNQDKSNLRPANLLCKINLYQMYCTET